MASVAILGLRKPHGTRLRYMAGCKCVPCRAANSNYETGRGRLRRLGLANGLVDAGKARRHMLNLTRFGVGRRTIRLRTGISDTVLQKVRSGKRQRIRALTERAILSVTHRDKRGGANIRATDTWERINWLLEEGFTKARIARELGRKMPALQLQKEFVTVKNAKAVEALWRRYQ